MATLHCSSDYIPLPDNWQPPTWIPESPKLHPVDSTITDRLMKATQGRMLSLPSRLPPPSHRIVTVLIKATSVLIGLSCATAVTTLPFVLKNSIAPSFVDLPLWQRCMYLGSALLAGEQILQVSSDFVEKQLRNNWENSNDFKKFHISPLPPINEKELDYLMTEARKNPLFEQMWNHVSVNFGPIQVVFPDKKPPSMGASDARACFTTSLSNHKISISQPIIHIMNNQPLHIAFPMLIFELANLFQAERFIALYFKVDSEKTDRNQFALLKEYIEAETINLTRQTIEYGIQHLNWNPNLNRWNRTTDFNFADHWKLCNMSESPSILSHADNYRKTWDEYYGKSKTFQGTPGSSIHSARDLSTVQ